MVTGILSTIVLPVLLGGCLAAPFHRFTGVAGWLAAGAVTGLTLFTSLCYLFSLRGGIKWPVVFFSLGVLCTAAFAVTAVCTVSKEKEREADLAESRGTRRVSLAIVVSCLVLVTVCLLQVIKLLPDGYYVGCVNNYGDLPLHIHYITSFLYGNNIPPQNPMFAGIPLRYPFFADFYSALVLFATGSIEASLKVPGIVLSAAFLVLLYQWVSQLTSRSLAGALSVLLVLLNGGFGWILWIHDLARQENFQLFPRSYTIMWDERFNFSNVIYTLLIPQRSFQFAFPQVILLSALCLQAAKEKDRKTFLFTALVAGCAPFFHGHQIIALTIFGIAAFCFYPSRAWLYLVVPLCLQWTPQVFFLARVIGPKVPDAESFIRIKIGWMSQGWGILVFWLKNAGVFIVLSIFSFWSFWPSRRDSTEKSDIYILALTGAAVFLLANTVSLAPWDFDNLKLVIFWYVYTLPLVSLFLVHLYRQRKLALSVAAALCLILLVFSGILDVTKVLTGEGEIHQILSRNDIAAAGWIQEHTPKDALFLAEPSHNQPLVLAGRKMVLGFSGHAWTHGIPSDLRSSHVKAMGQGLPEAILLLNLYGVTHAIYGDRERGASFNEDFIRRYFSLMAKVDGINIYKRKYTR